MYTCSCYKQCVKHTYHTSPLDTCTSVLGRAARVEFAVCDVSYQTTPVYAPCVLRPLLSSCLKQIPPNAEHAHRREKHMCGRGGQIPRTRAWRFARPFQHVRAKPGGSLASKS